VDCRDFRWHDHSHLLHQISDIESVRVRRYRASKYAKSTLVIRVRRVQGHVRKRIFVRDDPSPILDEAEVEDVLFVLFATGRSEVLIDEVHYFSG
jgi:hypothetical protein